MIIDKKVIVCDLDGTLTESKSTLSPDMAEVLCSVLKSHFLCVVSGGSFRQFEKQFLSGLSCGSDEIQNLYLFPTMGSTCYVYDKEGNSWKQLYEERLNDAERENVINSFKEAIAETGFDLSGSYGEIIEDRGSQVTFSGRGQVAPLEVKEAWDPDQSKRRMIIEILAKKIPNFNVQIGGISSIDVTKKGIDKAYAIEKIKSILHVLDDDIIFVGDALYSMGNDSAVKRTGVDFIQESGPEETIEFLRQYI